MCDPVTIAGVALTGLSTGLNYAAQAKAQNARDDAMAAERIRQSGLDKEADALNVQSQERYEGFEGKQDERSSSLADFFTSQQVPEPGAAEALPASSSNIAVRNEQKERGKAKEFTDRTGTALGELRSFGDLLGGIGRDQARDAGLIGQIGGFKRGSSGVLPFELDAASHAGDGLGLFADLAGGAGGLATSYGLSGTGGLFGGGSLPKTASIPTARPGIVGDPWSGMRSKPVYGGGARASGPGYSGVSSLY
jgi:hypothetical protein